MRRFVLLGGAMLAALMGLADSVWATRYDIPLVRPPDSTLQLVKEVRKGGLTAWFVEQQRVSGVFVAEWAAGAASPYEEPMYYLLPDKASKEKLPHFRRYGIDSIEVRNGREAFVMTVGRQQAEKLLARKLTRLSMQGVFVIDDYEVGVECDAPWAKARVIPVEKLLADSGHAQYPEGC